METDETRSPADLQRWIAGMRRSVGYYKGKYSSIPQGVAFNPPVSTNQLRRKSLFLVIWIIAGVAVLDSGGPSRSTDMIDAAFPAIEQSAERNVPFDKCLSVGAPELSRTETASFDYGL